MTDNAAPDAKPKRRIQTMLYGLAVIALLLAALWAFGPREPVETALRFDPAAIGADVEAYLADTEGRFDDIVEGAEKQIVWAFPNSRARTPVALVYVHGFSASAGEIRPVPDMAAAALGANLHYTRLAGHGRPEAAMAGPTVQDWIDDVAEAVAIGERLGEKVVLIGTSTGGTLAAVAALHPDLKDRIGGIIFVSPNFKVKAAGSGMLTAPFARQLVPLLAGAERAFEPANELHARFWTERYPSTALLPMAAVVAHARAQAHENAMQPALFMFSDADRIVDHTVTRRIAERWGGPAEIVAMTRSDDPDDHVIAGDALSPSNNGAVADAIADWVRAL